MKIAFITERTYPLHGGCETRYYHLATEIIKQGHEVTFITGLGDITNSEIRSDGVECQNIDQINLVRFKNWLPRIRRRSLFDLINFGKSINNYLLHHSSEYDIIEVNTIPMFHLLLLNKEVTSQVIFTWHELWGSYWDSIIGIGHIGKKIERNLLELGKAQVIVSDFTKLRMDRVTDFLPNQKVIPNGVNTTLLSLRHHPSEQIRFLFVGRLVEEKNVFPFLVRTMRKFNYQYPKSILHIVGHGPLKQKIQEFSENKNYIHFHGTLSDAELLELLSHTDVFLHPSSREGSGIAALEAMAAGCPVVTLKGHYNATAFELVRHGWNGYIAEEDEFVEYMRQAWLELPELGQNAREFASKFQWGDISRDLVDFYQEINNL